ncbi:lutropin-choriogonadotropic hormone receptor-like [Bacillus rossius redtenbacheri]|uniref:lutropin-choriogonadotropic hormone receptor-like n=1 Tax=Bacillus rossius redtenbacheri TaxID=93214 RepID=UPI002FDD99C7
MHRCMIGRSGSLGGVCGRSDVMRCGRRGALRLLAALLACRLAAGSGGCPCYNGTETERLYGLELEPECRCQGRELSQVPGELPSYMRRLIISYASIEVLKNTSLRPYETTLRDLTLINVKNFREIEPKAFYNLSQLLSIYIYQAPSLTSIAPAVFDVELPRFKTLRIVHTGLRSVPDLTKLRTDSIMHMIDLENNQIKKIPSKTFNVNVEQLLLNYNIIEEIQAYAFFGSRIGMLSLKGNQVLRVIHMDAFVGLHSLRELDLSKTSITFFPVHGLNDLDILRIENTYSLKEFPSVFHFKSIREAWLTYPYHCCAFQFPLAHDPDEFRRHQEFVASMEKECSTLTTATSETREARSAFSQWETDLWNSSHGSDWGGLGSGRYVPAQEPGEMFHQQGVTLGPGKVHAMCGNLSKNYRDVACRPAPDAFNPCEDLMGNWSLRVAVWLVSVAAVLGNLAVLLVLLSSRFRVTVPKFLMCNLAFADLCIGLYLALLAGVDARSVGTYFNHAIDWQNGPGCEVAGFLTVFASELSVFTLMVITSERWYTITYAIHLNKRLKLSSAGKIMTAGWVYSLTMASLPIFGVSGYYKTSICLPLDISDSTDLAYIVVLLSFNGLAFLVICACYTRMYCSIKGGQDAVAALARSDMTVAKRMALLVFTDFACWAPIAFFGLTALAGRPLIDVSHTKILLVFFYPLNSCANPYLYALLTQQYRRDLFVLLSRYGLCSRRAARYKGAAAPAATGCAGRMAAACAGAGGGGGCGPPGPHQGHAAADSHRGSLLTSVTSVDSGQAAARAGSLTAVPEAGPAAGPQPPPPPAARRQSTVELFSLDNSLVGAEEEAASPPAPARLTTFL